MIHEQHNFAANGECKQFEDEIEIDIPFDVLLSWIKCGLVQRMHTQF